MVAVAGVLAYVGQKDLNGPRSLGLHNGLIDLVLAFSLNSVAGFQTTELTCFQN